MEAAWKNIAHSFSLKSESSDTLTKNAAEEKRATQREANFISMVASNMSKASVFRSWQLEQLEGLVPMARLHSIISNDEDRIAFEDASESKIVLCKLKSRRFETHRTCCYPEYIDQIRQSKRTLLLVLDGSLTIHEQNCTKHLARGQNIVFSQHRETKHASASNELLPSVSGFSKTSSSDFGNMSYSSRSAFFLLLSDIAINSVAKTILGSISSNVQFSLHGNTAIRSQAITLDVICQAMNCEATVFYPGEVHSFSEGMLSIIVCGLCAQNQGEKIAARLMNTCNIRQIALTRELSLSQAVFFAIQRKRGQSTPQLKQAASGQLKYLDSGPNNDSAIEINSAQNEISIQKNERVAEPRTGLQPKFSTGKIPNEDPTNLIAHAVRCTENPFIMKQPAFSSLDLEGTLPQSPSVSKKKSLLQRCDQSFQMLQPGLAESTTSSATLLSPRVDEAVLLSGKKVSKHTAFWGYTPDMQTPLSNAKFYWALIRLFVNSCTKKIQVLLGKGEPLDVSSLCGFQNECQKGQLFHNFWTVSVVYTLPCSQVLHIFNPILYAVSRVATWHSVLREKPHFRNAENIENLLTGTSNLKCFSCIPETTRRVLLNRCLFEEWPPGALILCTLFDFVCFTLDDVCATDTIPQQLFLASHACVL
jgi:hypothetical protein